MRELESFNFKPEDFRIKSLGERKFPLASIAGMEKLQIHRYWLDDRARIPLSVDFMEGGHPNGQLAFEKAGPREFCYFDPKEVKVGMVTCGGTCPGLNNVIRALFMELYHIYGVSKIYGYRYGYRGLDPSYPHPPVRLTPKIVKDINDRAGSILGTSRGNPEPSVMVDTLVSQDIKILFAVGGDGTQRGAHAIAMEIERRGLDIAVVGVPKTIDNDVNFVYRTFGFYTAVSVARGAINAAHTEAEVNPGGIGLVKLMGRDSGFIAAYATLASLNVNFTLIPEVPFNLHGKGCLLEQIEKRLDERDHAVIAVAEGAGKELMAEAARVNCDAGHLRYADIGVFLKDEINRYFAEKGREINLKYIDPSYMLRSIPADAHDSIYTGNLARYAVHAAMAGKTDMMIGLWHNHFVNVPLSLSTAHPKRVDLQSHLWLSVLQSTGQPASMATREQSNGGF